MLGTWALSAAHGELLVPSGTPDYCGVVTLWPDLCHLCQGQRCSHFSISDLHLRARLLVPANFQLGLDGPPRMGYPALAQTSSTRPILSSMQ
ncbi:hypothetical protein AAFF_G00281190 [Aldrovandia affinis]|uniref:Uncharacterized protein n=1 Tax=Aldrovandia affinis TaxID=143900 RepID=A0AAD7W1W4_9TELE|nr:hypothetical protein AAFF_G00281190 [Aldrovandia affinis]